MDHFLHIKTRGIQQGFHPSVHYHRYEPTPYEALEKLFESYTYLPNAHIVDYGCGKGRVGFYVNALHQLSYTGIEMDESFIKDAKENLVTFKKWKKQINRSISFHLGFAQDYRVRTYENIFYFFNPFSVQVFMKVIKQIMLSFEENPRDMDLILYYPTVAYRDFLERHTGFLLFKQIPASDKIKTDASECFMIFRLEKE